MPTGQREDLKSVRGDMCYQDWRCCSKVHWQDGSEQWTVKSLARRASLYQICDSISLRCPLKPVQPVVPGRGWVTSSLCLRRLTLENTCSSCLKALRVWACHSLSREASQEASPKVSPSLPISPSRAGRCLNQSEGKAPGSCSWGLMQPQFPDMAEMAALSSDTASLS